MEQATRPEFLHLAGWEVALFYILCFGSLGIAAAQIFATVRRWRIGKPIAPLREGWKAWVPTKPTLEKWLKNVWNAVLLQRRVRRSRKKSGAPMHLLIFYGFLSMFVATTLLAIATYSHKLGLPNFHKGSYYLWYELTFDILGLPLFFGLVWALFRRVSMQKRAGRPITTTDTSDFLTLALLLIITCTGYLLEAGRIAVNPQPFDNWSVVGYQIAKAMNGLTPDGYRGVWWFHMVWVFIFFAVFPRMRLRHVLLAIFSTAGMPDRPMGKLVPISMEEVEQTGQIGVTTPKEYSRWHLLSLDACMECGRCTEVCPAWNVGKELNPKLVVQDIRKTGDDENVAAKVGEEVLWQCTTCHACVDACPVGIRHVDLIVDARRNLVAEGKLSGSSAVMLRQTGSTGHAWGSPRAEREVWMEGLDIPLCRDGNEFEYLFWVGCAGATDPGAVKTTKAFAQLMKKAGVSFACLGQEEACTGDPARRVGDEFLFQEKAAENVSVFQKYGVKKVVTACPHCFNTLKNEYGDFEAEIEVYHHSQLLAELVSAGKLKPADGKDTVFHDPCYLGRVNDESDAPRKVLGENTNYNGKSPDGINVLIRPEKLLEPKFYGSKTRCCGAGGGRMWMEEPIDQRPNNVRAEELLATGAKTIALGCPFCRIMVDAGVKSVTDDESIRLLDLAELLQEANS